MATRGLVTNGGLGLIAVGLAGLVMLVGLAKFRGLIGSGDGSIASIVNSTVSRLLVQELSKAAAPAACVGDCRGSQLPPLSEE